MTTTSTHCTHIGEDVRRGRLRDARRGGEGLGGAKDASTMSAQPGLRNVQLVT
jgi:hypothetical protein